MVEFQIHSSCGHFYCQMGVSLMWWKFKFICHVDILTVKRVCQRLAEVDDVAETPIHLSCGHFYCQLSVVSGCTGETCGI